MLRLVSAAACRDCLLPESHTPVRAKSVGAGIGCGGANQRQLDPLQYMRAVWLSR